MILTLETSPLWTKDQRERTKGKERNRNNTTKMNSKYVCLFDQVACYRVKSGEFGHQVNSDTHLQTVEIQMRLLLMSVSSGFHCLFS